jgi:hypothetical protein
MSRVNNVQNLRTSTGHETYAVDCRWWSKSRFGGTLLYRIKRLKLYLNLEPRRYIGLARCQREFQAFSSQLPARYSATFAYPFQMQVTPRNSITPVPLVLSSYLGVFMLPQSFPAPWEQYRETTF